MSKRFFAAMLALAALMIMAPFAVAQGTAADTKADAKATTESGSAPRLTLVEPVKDFGTVPRGQKIDWSFLIKNTGASDLEIIAAKPSCGCTVADFDKIIKPGTTGKVTAHVDTTHFSGPITKAVTLETNDPTAPTAQVSISAIVKPYVEAYPTGLVRFNLVQGQVEKRSILLYSEEEEPFEIVKIDSPRDWIRVESMKAEGEDVVDKVGRPKQAQYRIDITAGGPDTTPGPVAEKIHVVTNSKHEPDYWISVSGAIRPPYRVEPPSVNFGDVSPAADAATRTVTIRSNNIKTPETFVVSGADSGVAGVTADVKPTANRGEYQVTLHVAKDAKPGALEGNVLVHTSDTVNPVATISVRGNVKAPPKAETKASTK